MPKKLLITAPETVEWVQYDEPPLQAGQVRIRPHHSAAKHGTEMAFYKGYANPRGSWDPSRGVFAGSAPADPYPFAAGNMFVGEVVDKADDVTSLEVGDEVFGHGGFAETHTAKAGAIRKLPQGMDWRSAVCLDPAEFALGALRDAQIGLGDNVAVFGLGAIGLMAVQMAQVAGAARVIAVEPLANRRAAAGTDTVLDPTSCDAGLRIRELTDGRGTDVCIDFSGSGMALQQALRGVAFGGTVVCGSFPPPYAGGLDFGAEAHMNRPTLVFSRACSDPNRRHPRWSNERVIRTCFDLLAAGRIEGASVVDPICRFEELPEFYPRIAEAPESNIKLGCAH
jgi:2-desacetyl-2-hydroxyethyl bacteriochlorophyllide A dehydrogenase